MESEVDPKNPSHALALVLTDELCRVGVTDVVLAPGSRSTALALAVHAEARLRLHVHVDERSAGFVALGVARATGRPAVVITTSGSAVANLHPAVVEADTGHMPLLLLTADRPGELRQTGANQTISQANMFGSAPRWQVDLPTAEDRPDANALWRTTIDRAVAACLGAFSSPGPVHLNVPFREPTIPVEDDGRSRANAFVHSIDGRAAGAPWTDVEPALRTPSADTISSLAEQIANTAHGLLVAGTTDAPPAAMLALAEVTGWPLVAEATSSMRTGEHAIAHASLLLTDDRFAGTHTPELVVRIGRTGLSRQLDAFLASSRQILIDPYEFADSVRAVDQVITADVEATCTWLAQAISNARANINPAVIGGVDTAAETGVSSAANANISAGLDTNMNVKDGGVDGPWRAAWRDADARVRRCADVVLDATVAASGPATARDLGACLPEGSTLVVAASMPVRDLDRFLASRNGLRVVANRGASGIDGTVSTTLGIATASDGPTVALVGDLALLHDANGFLLDAEVDATFVVVDNDGGGIFSFLPQAQYTDAFERVFATPHRRDLADLARFHGLGYQKVTEAAGLTGAVTTAIGAGGIQLVHVRTDRDRDVSLHRQVATEVANALS